MMSRVALEGEGTPGGQIHTRLSVESGVPLRWMKRLSHWRRAGSWACCLRLPAVVLWGEIANRSMKVYMGWPYEGLHGLAI